MRERLRTNDRSLPAVLSVRMGAKLRATGGGGSYSTYSAPRAVSRTLFSVGSQVAVSLLTPLQ